MEFRCVLCKMFRPDVVETCEGLDYTVAGFRSINLTHLCVRELAPVYAQCCAGACYKLLLFAHPVGATQLLNYTINHLLKTD